MRSFLLILLAAAPAAAELKLPGIFSDHMVLQQQLANPIWGWDTPGTEISVRYAGQTLSATAGKDGKWSVKLPPLPASANPSVLEIKGSTTRTIQDVLVGEVWICSGQSNMRWTVSNSWDADLEIASAKHPHIRLLQVPNVGTQEPQTDFDANWEVCSPDSVGNFSAVGFFYGRILHQILDVPVGLINNAWGGSAAEAWVRRDLLENDARFATLMTSWKQREADLESEQAAQNYQKALAAWKKKAAAAKTAGQPFTARPPQSPEQILTGNQRPGNIYNGVLLPSIGYGIKGVIWYQGESNAARAHEYASLFPFMIQHWRDEWKQGDFPFYWVQLADFKDEASEPGDSDWAELRESQTKTQQALPNAHQAVIIDLGEGNDIHPKNKRDVAERLARIALARDYGLQINWRSPEFKEAVFKDGKAFITLDTFGSSLRTLDTKTVKGFAICGEDRKWVWADAVLAGRDQVEVHASSVPNPVAVRYAWSDNPVCNLYSAEGLPVTPFRSDDFPMITAPKPVE